MYAGLKIIKYINKNIQREERMIHIRYQNVTIKTNTPRRGIEPRSPA